MPTITISREFGSEGGHIAQQVAQVLGYHLADRKTVARLLGLYGFTGFDNAYDAVPQSFWTHSEVRREGGRELMVDTLNQVILALARHGNLVIIGRGGFAVLGGFANVLNVRIQAPLPMRVKWVMEEQKLTRPDEAEAVVREGDQVRASFIESFYGVRWDASNAFDLVLDTGKISPELAVTWLVETARNLKRRPGGPERTTETIQVDPALAAAVAADLKCQITHG
jgi:cytidylate kinase